MAFVAVYDACVLYPAHLRDLLVRLALANLVQAKWSARILDEAFGALAANRPELAGRLPRTRQLMTDAIRDGIVTGYEPLVEGLDLPDPDDRHVLAVAIRCHAQLIVTNNVTDFPVDKLEPYGVEAVTADTFVHNLIDLDERAFLRVVHQMVAPLRAPPMTPLELVALLERDGLSATATALRPLLRR